MALRPLSQAAVAELGIGSNLDADELFQLTNGNPFFITEVISVGETGTTGNGTGCGPGAGGTPLSGSADGAGRQCSHRLAHRILAAESLGFNADPISETIAGGMLLARGMRLAFRHELARQAVLDALAPVARRELHRRVLAALRVRSHGRRARLAHHAAEADDARGGARLRGRARPAPRRRSARIAKRRPNTSVRSVRVPHNRWQCGRSCFRPWRLEIYLTERKRTGTRCERSRARTRSAAADASAVGDALRGAAGCFRSRSEES